MNMQQKIEKIILDNLQPKIVRVENQSHLHQGHAGDDGSGESHFEVFIVSEAFEGINRVSRHRMIFHALQENLENLPHALSIKAFSTSEHK